MAERHPELENLLEGIRSEGTFVSQGNFTLDLVQAREKLKRFQLLDPYHYVLPLVSAVVLGGGRTLRCRVGPAFFSMEFDGAAFSPEELEGMFSALLISSSVVGRRRIAELAVGINAALALSPREIKLDSWDHQRRVQALFTPRKQKVEVGEAPGTAPWTTISVQHAGIRALWRKTQRDAPEVQALHNRCRLAPLELTINDKLLPRVVGWEKQPCLVASYLKAGEPRPGCGITLGKLKARVTRTSETRGPYSAVVSLGSDASEEVVFVHHGLAFRRPDLSLGPGTRAVVWAPELKRDLSQTNIIEDETFEIMLEQLRLEIFAMLNQLEGKLSQLSEWPVEERREALDQLERLVGFRVQNGDWPGAYKLSKAIVNAREPDSLHYQLSDYAQALLESRDKRNHPDAVMKRFSETLGALAKTHGLELKRIFVGNKDDSVVSRFGFEGSFKVKETIFNRLLAVEEQLFGLRDELVLARMQKVAEELQFKRPARSKELKLALVEAQKPMERQLASQARYHGKQIAKVSLRD